MEHKEVTPHKHLMVFSTLSNKQENYFGIDQLNKINDGYRRYRNILIQIYVDISSQ